MADITNLKSDTSPFTVRKPKLQLLHLGIIAALIFFVLSITSSTDNWLLQSFIFLIASCFFVFLLYILQNRNFDDKTATEFQCLVFSGAMRSNTFLTLIIYQDGSLFYLDPRYSMNFEKGSPHHNLEQILTTVSFPNGDKVKIYDAIQSLKTVEFDFSYKYNEKQTMLKVSVSPIQRPSGFVCLTISEK